MGGRRRTAFTIGVEQQMDIFAKQFGAKVFGEIDPDRLDTGDWVAWNKLRNLAAQVSTLNS